MDSFALLSTAIAAGAVATNSVLWVRAVRRIRTWKKEREGAQPDVWPSAHVFVCLKGRLPRLAESVRSLASQQYPGAFRTTFIVERSDPVFAEITRLVSGSERMDIVAVGRVTESGLRCAQKNFNLLSGIAHAESLAAPPGVYAFCDGDLVVTATWLTEMIRPIALGKADVSTSFHFVESRDRAVLGALHGMAETWQSIAALLCRGATWGGSMSILRSVFHDVRLADVWRETVVDDLTMFRVMKAQRIRVAPVPQFLVTSKSEISSYRGFVRWLGRQFFFVKIYSPFWYFVLGAQMMLNGISIAVATWHVSWRVAFGVWPSGGAIGAVTILAAAAVFASFYFSRFLIPERPPIRAWFGAALLVNAASLLACADATLRRRKLTWSDFTYFLTRDGRVARIVGAGLATGIEPPTTEDEPVPERAIA